MIHGSLFSGIGGFDLGFERAGIKTIWQVEIDDYCRRVLAPHFPTATRYDDVRTVGKHNLAPVDIVSGGFPCQDISNAGKRAGIDGERSGLWSEYARIIRELRPRYVVVENVAALLHRGMERVLGDLAACGYDAEWQSIRASDVGAPHRRERIWIVAYSNGSRSHLQSWLPVFQWQGLSNASNSNGRGLTMQGESPECDGFASRSGEDVADAAQSKILARSCEIQARAEQEEPDGSRDCLSAYWQYWAVEPDVGRVAHGIPSRVDRLKGLGNAIVPQIAEYIGWKIKNAS